MRWLTEFSFVNEIVSGFDEGILFRTGMSIEG